MRFFSMRRVALDFGFAYRQSVFIAGMGRSGTTWIAEVLNYDRRYRTVFEPFHPGQVSAAAHLDPLRYRRPTTEDSLLLKYSRRVLTGRVGGPWIDRFNRRLISRRRLVKEIRANLWLKWLKLHFPDLPIILVMRHPCAVAESWMRLRWPNRVPDYFSQPDLVADFLAPFRECLGDVSTAFECYIVAWCIQHLVPLRQFAPGDLHVIFYERLLTHPEATIAAASQFLGARFDDRVFRALVRPSAATTRESDARAVWGIDLAAAWQKRVPAEARKRATEILRWFGLDAIYCEDPLPIITKGSPFSSS
jgi:hypothetical protein